MCTLPCIVDTACGNAYLLCSPELALPFVTSSSRGRVRLADGSVCQLQKSVIGKLRIGGRETRRCELGVIQTDATQPTAILFGRELLSAFNINTRGATQVLMRSGGDEVILYDASGPVDVTDTIRRVFESIDEPLPDATLQGVVPLVAPATLERLESSVRLPIAPDDQALLDRALAELSRAPPQPLSCCPGRVSLAPLNSLEGIRSMPDTVDQQYSFFLSLDHQPATSPNGPPPRLYASRVFNTLPDEDKRAFKDQVDAYVQSSWWTPTDQANARKHGPVANVFAIRQGPKVRLVIDYRERNKTYPSTTSPPLISFSVALMRTMPRGNIYIADAASAFYRVRSSPTWTHCGPLGDFLCHRMGFGVSYGPEVLQSTYGTLWRLYSKVAPNSTGVLFVDDSWVHEAAPSTVSSGVPALLHLMSRCGFNVDRKKFQVLTVETDKPVEFMGMQFFNTKRTGSWYRGITCPRSSMTAKHFEDLMLRPTRAQVYALCGEFSYDATREHLAEKIISDLLRSITGSYGGTTKAAWRQPLDLDSFSGPDRLLYESLIRWAKELVDSTKPCCHLIPVAPTQDRMNLRLFSDASHAGGSFIIQFSPNIASATWHTIWGDAWFWKKGEQNRHCNRLEATSLYRGLRACSKFIEFQASSRLGQLSIPVHLAAFCDSSTAVSWSRKPPNSESFESREIERASAGLRSECHHLRKLCTSFTLQHLSGHLNADADTLSRLLERPCGLQGHESITLASLIRKRNEARTPKRAERAAEPSDAVLLVRPSRVGEPVLSELVASESFDLAHALETFRFLASVVQSWKRVTDDLRRGQGGGGRVPFGNDDSIVACDIDFTELFARSAQALIAQRQRFTANPFSALPSGVIEHTRFQVDGSFSRTFVIPKEAEACQRLIIKHFHRLIHHRGAKHTASSIKGFWIEHLTAATHRVVSSCVRCAIKNAVRSWALPAQTLPREVSQPAFTRLAMDFLHLEKTTVCSFVCIDTGLFCLLLANPNTTSTDAAVDALRRLSNRFYVTVRHIRADRASAFTSPLFRSKLVKEGFDPTLHLDFTTPEAPYTNPVERLHRETLSIIRCQKFLRLCIVDSCHPWSKQEKLDEISHIINTRPIGWYAEDGDEDVLTPAKLAFSGSGVFNKTHLVRLRKYFYERCFEILRRVHHSPTTYPRRSSLIIGQRCLLFNPTSKLSAPYQLAKVIDIVRPYIVVRTSEGQEKTVGANQLAALPLFEDDRAPYDVSRCGARVAIDYAGVIFHGTVVKDLGRLVEVCWDPISGVEWSNEYILWSASGGGHVASRD